MVAFVGGALGFVIAYWLARGIVSLAPDDLPRVAEIAVNAPVALFTLGAVVVVAMISAIVPLVHASRERHADARGQPRDRRAVGTSRAFPTTGRADRVVVVLMVAAGLVLRSFRGADACRPRVRLDQRLERDRSARKRFLDRPTSGSTSCCSACGRCRASRPRVLSTSVR